MQVARLSVAAPLIASSPPVSHHHHRSHTTRHCVTRCDRPHNHHSHRLPSIVYVGGHRLSSTVYVGGNRSYRLEGRLGSRPIPEHRSKRFSTLANLQFICINWTLSKPGSLIFGRFTPSIGALATRGHQFQVKRRAKEDKLCQTSERQTRARHPTPPGTISQIIRIPTVHLISRISSLRMRIPTMAGFSMIC